MKPLNRLVPPHLACAECERWCVIWHDFWTQVTIVALLTISAECCGCIESRLGEALDRDLRYRALDSEPDALLWEPDAS